MNNSGIILIILSFLLIGCEGPAGPAGPQGEAGPEGPQGPQGDDGTANVMYSPWINFDVDNWTSTTEFGRSTQVYEVQEELITQEIINTGLVLVYVRFGGSQQPRVLPFIGYITTTTKEQILWNRLSEGGMEIVFYNVGNNDDPGTFGSGNSFRYVIVPGGNPINSKKSKEAGTLSHKVFKNLSGFQVN